MHRTANSSRQDDHLQPARWSPDLRRPGRSNAPGRTGHAMRPGGFPAPPRPVGPSRKGPLCQRNTRDTNQRPRDRPGASLRDRLEQRTYQVDLAVDQRLYPLTYAAHRVGDKELRGSALRSRSATAAGPRPACEIHCQARASGASSVPVSPMPRWVSWARSRPWADGQYRAEFTSYARTGSDGDRHRSRRAVSVVCVPPGP